MMGNQFMAIPNPNDIEYTAICSMGLSTSSELPPNKSLQRMFDPPPIFSATKMGGASLPARWRGDRPDGGLLWYRRLAQGARAGDGYRDRSLVGRFQGADTAAGLQGLLVDAHPAERRQGAGSLRLL